MHRIFKTAREVAEKIGTVHHEMTYTIQEGLDAIRDVIYHIETYDVTTIRASTLCTSWDVRSKQWVLKWFFLVKVRMKGWLLLFPQSTKRSRVPR